MKRKVLLILLLAAFLLLLVFVIQNAEPVNISFLFWDGMAPLSVLVILAFIIGLVAGVIYESVVAHMRHAKAQKEQQLKDYVTNLEAENDNLKKERDAQQNS